MKTRPKNILKVNHLFGYSYDELAIMAKDINCIRNRLILQSVLLYLHGDTSVEIAQLLGLTPKTIQIYIHAWNGKGLNCLRDDRGGNIPSKFTEEILDHLYSIVTTSSPRDHGFINTVWTSELLCMVVKQKYMLDCSQSHMKRLLKQIGLSYKRGQYKPTKCSKEEKETFKKKFSIL